MAIINYSASRINELLAAAETAAQPDEVSAAMQKAEEDINATIGQLSGLETAEKGTVVGAINENFTSAGEGKQTIAAALTGRGQVADGSETFEELSSLIDNLQPADYVDPALFVQRLVTNDEAITPTGTYATSTYYNADYGVKIGYCPDGSILLSMRSGTSTGYENLNFFLSSAPDGVTIERNSTSWDTGDPAGNLYVCRISGITTRVEIAVAMTEINSSYDYTNCAITITEVTA